MNEKQESVNLYTDLKLKAISQTLQEQIDILAYCLLEHQEKGQISFFNLEELKKIVK
jgi:hypothetical protein